MKSIKIDEETYKHLLKLKYEHAMRGIKLTFSDLVKGLLLGTCHLDKEKKETEKTSGCGTKELRHEKQSTHFA
ncbi:MAG: hypothetical protein ACTSXW_03100 [Candidatus Baldrarchaeia archaeon]